jgi:YidC/Oxa1 family membrane protein insertase
MQPRNLVAFIIATLLIMVGWFWLQRQLWPPPERKAADKKEEVARKSEKEPAKPEPPPVRLSPQEQDLAQRLVIVGLQPLAPPGLGGLLTVAPQIRPAGDKIETVELGGPDYYIRARLTTRGAGVERLTLTKFKAADELGRPVYTTGPDGERVAALLDLIPTDPFRPSFTLNHYPDPAKAGEEPPVATLGEKVWKLAKRPEAGGDEQEVRFSTSVPGYDHLTLTRIYNLKKRDYHIGLTIEIKDERDPKGKGREQSFCYQFVGPHGLPIEGDWYAYTYRNAIIGMVDSRNNLWRTLEDARRISHREGGDRVPEGSRGKDFLQYAVVANQYFASGIVVDNNQPAESEGGVDPRSIVAWARPTLETYEVGGRVKLVNLKANHIVIIPVGKTGRATAYELLPRVREQIERLGLEEGDDVLLNVFEAQGRHVAAAIHRGSGSRPFLDDITVRVNSEVIDLKPGETRVHKFLLYQGPVKVNLLGYFRGNEAVDPDLVVRYSDTLHLSTLTDYRSSGPFGWIASKTGLTTVFIFCTNLMHWLLDKLLLVVRIEGLSIIFLTVIVRALMFPISRKQALMSQKMQAVAPELKKLQEKYKNDPQARTQAMMELYRKHGVNPLGGCLPLLLQMPIFLGLYWALQESIRFRLAPFLWIKNLAAPDMLLYWGQWIPWLTEPNNMGGFLYLGPFLNVLPVLAVTLMLAQQKMIMPPPTDEQQAMQQKMMKWMMIFMGILFYKVAAGLCIYFIASSLWGLAERKLLPKKQTAATAAPGGGPGGPPGGGRGPAPSGRGPSGRAKARGKKPPEDKRLQKVRDWWAEILKQAKKK